MHRIYHGDLPGTSGVDLIIGGEEAHHAVRVKRVRVGETVGLLDGRGGLGEGAVAAVRRRGGESELVVRVDRVERAPPVAPAVAVCSPAPRQGRLEEMLDGLSQVGAASWRPLAAARAQPGGERPDRWQRIVEEAAKQCGRAWFLELEPVVMLEEALRLGDVVMADGRGEPYQPRSRARITLLVGPEGGWTDAERGAAGLAGARLCRFGPHTMRIETAAVAAAAVILDRHLREAAR